MTATQLFATSLANFISIYSLLLLVRILLTWFQTMEWANNIAAFLSPITDPYLNIFRSFIPPLGGIDLSPIVAIFVLNFIGAQLGRLSQII